MSQRPATPMTAGPLKADSITDDTNTWATLRERLHARGLRWTAQRRVLLDVLDRTQGHVTGAELVERCRELDPSTTPSTVYRTLDVLEDLGVVRHHHRADGREEFHVRPEAAHGHLHCQVCGRSWELGQAEVLPLVSGLRQSRDFDVDLSHVSVSGRCAECQRSAVAPAAAAARDVAAGRRASS